MIRRRIRVGRNGERVLSGGDAQLGWSAPNGLSSGNSLVISTDGTYNFGTKPNGAKPWLYLPHGADLNPDTNYSRGTASNLSHTGCSFTSGTYPTNGSGSLRCLMNSSSNCPGWTFDASGPGELYTFTHRKFGYDALHDAVATNLKTWRAWTDVNGSFPPNSDVIVAYTTGSITTINPLVDIGLVPAGAGGDNSVYWDDTRLDYLTTQWHSSEVAFARSGSSGVADGKLWHWTDGKLQVSTSTLTSYDGTWTANTYKQLFFAQISNNTEPADYFYHGPTLIDDSLCRVITSTEPTWHTGSTNTYVRDFQLPTAWVASQITITLRQGIHDTLSGKYLYVIKSDGNPVTTSGLQLG